MLDAVLDAALASLELARGAIYLRRGEADEVELEASRGFPPGVVARKRTQRIAAHGSGIAGTTAHRQGAFVIGDLSKEPVGRPLVEAFREAGVAVSSVAAVPVAVEGRPMGALMVVSEAPREFSEGEVAYLRLVGALLGWTTVAQAALREHAKTNEELAALARALEQRTAELKELDKYKTRSIHLITHELRRPLSPIFTYADMLLGMEFPPEKRRLFLEHIREAADEMDRYVTEMVETAKLEEGGVQLVFGDVDVAAVARVAVGKWQQVAADSGVSLDLDVQLERRKFTTDGVKIGEVLENLIENALKYTQSGGKVTVTARKAPDSLEFAVADTGIGIAPEEVAELFTKFHIVRQANVPRPAHRAGLGLYLSKVYAEALGGTVAVESRPGKGSTFTLRVPVGA